MNNSDLFEPILGSSLVHSSILRITHISVLTTGSWLTQIPFYISLQYILKLKPFHTILSLSESLIWFPGDYNMPIAYSAKAIDAPFIRC
jgi:hypothetical protein